MSLKAGGGWLLGAGLAVGWLSVATAAQTDPVKEAKKVLAKTVEAMQRPEKVSAKITQTIDLLGTRFTADGTYVRHGNARWRLDLTYQIANARQELIRHTLLDVCDGQTWWKHTRVFGTDSYKKIDFKTLVQTVQGMTFKDPEDKRLVLRQFGFGGMFPLIEGVERFAELKVVSRPQSSTKGQWVLAGPVTQRAVDQMLNRKPGSEAAKAPAAMLQHCKVVIDVGDGQWQWPKRVELTSARNPTRDRQEPYSLVLEFSDVRVNDAVTLKADTFTLTVPPEQEKTVKDVTKSLLKGLRTVSGQPAQPSPPAGPGG